MGGVHRADAKHCVDLDLLHPQLLLRKLQTRDASRLNQDMGSAVLTLDALRALEAEEEQEESVLALLGIVGTFLNLFVIVFVYIYTTV